MVTLRGTLHLDDDSTATYNNHGVFMTDRQIEKGRDRSGVKAHPVEKTLAYAARQSHKII